MKISKDLVEIAVLWATGFMFVVLVLLALFSTEHWNIEIRQSYSTGECVSMIVYDKEHPTGKVHPCPDVLPEHYKHIWVQ
jgi:hypothetical protein